MLPEAVVSDLKNNRKASCLLAAEQDLLEVHSVQGSCFSHEKVTVLRVSRSFSVARAICEKFSMEMLSGTAV